MNSDHPEHIPSADVKQKPSSKGGNVISSIKEFFVDLFDIKDGMDRAKTVRSIREKVALKGEQVWMLIAATMIASVGLNLNSAAVIIGAMLISPLMSPILGIGLSVGINDRQLLINSLKNFSVAVIAVILTSAVYYKLSPFDEITSEIRGRTSPTILDAIIAFFGGIAGIVAGTRKDQSAAIPGVAIATALLPPLAVAGFGLAHSNWKFFLNAFYLFFLNSMLIAFATFIIVRWLRFPYKEFFDLKAKKRASFFIGAFVLAALLPSFFILRGLLNEQQRETNISAFFKSRFDTGENQMLGKAKLDNNITDSVLFYTVSYRGRDLVDSIENKYNKDLSEITGKPSFIDYTLLNLTEEQYKRLESDKSALNAQLSEQETKELSYRQQISSLQNQIDSLGYEERLFVKLEKDLKALYPEIESLSFADSYRRDFADSLANQQPVVMLKWSRKVNRAKRKEYEDQMRRYFNEQKGLEKTEIVRLN